MLVIHQEDVQALRQSRRAAKDPKRTKQATAVLELARGRSLPEVSRRLATSEDEVVHLVSRYKPVRFRSRRMSSKVQMGEKSRLGRIQRNMDTLQDRLVLLLNRYDLADAAARVPMPSREEFMALGVPRYEAVGADLDADPADLINLEDWLDAPR